MKRNCLQNEAKSRNTIRQCTYRGHQILASIALAILAQITAGCGTIDGVPQRSSTSDSRTAANSEGTMPEELRTNTEFARFPNQQIPIRRNDWLGRFLPSEPTELSMTMAPEFTTDNQAHFTFSFKNNAPDAQTFVLERSLNGIDGPYEVVSSRSAAETDKIPSQSSTSEDYRRIHVNNMNIASEICFMLTVREANGEYSSNPVCHSINTCSSDFDCSTNEFCAFAFSECNANSTDGVCKRTRLTCSTNYTPVCGCNGLTYSNPCLANRAGTSVAYEGQCGCRSDSECDDDNECTVDACNTESGQCEYSGVMCQDDNPCTVDHCNPNDGCIYVPVDCDTVDDEFEDNDQWPAAREINIGPSYTLHGFDSDWFWFEVNEPGTLSVRLDHVYGDNGDLDVFLFRQYVLQTQFDDATPLDRSIEEDTSNEYFTRTITAGTYYLLIEPWGGSPFSPARLAGNRASYALTVDFLPGNLLGVGGNNGGGIGGGGNNGSGITAENAATLYISGNDGAINPGTYHLEGASQIASYYDSNENRIMDLKRTGLSSLPYPLFPEAGCNAGGEPGRGYFLNSHIVVYASLNNDTEFVTLHIAHENNQLVPKLMIAGDRSLQGRILSTTDFANWQLQSDASGWFISGSVTAPPSFLEFCGTLNWIYYNEVTFNFETEIFPDAP